MARGSSANSGRAPDPNAIRNDRSGVAGWTVLPAAGRDGDTPEFPLVDETERESVIWARVWRLPQAVEWERNRQFDEVAMYVRALADAERAEAPVAARTLVKQLQESLGISLPGLARNRWRIDGGQQQSTKPQQAARRSSGGSSRDRFEVIAGGGS